MESEVLRLAENLKVEMSTTNALKRQLLQFSDIAERHKSGKDGSVDAGMEEVITAIGHLFKSQSNPMVGIRQ